MCHLAATNTRHHLWHITHPCMALQICCMTQDFMASMSLVDLISSFIHMCISVNLSLILSDFRVAFSEAFFCYYFFDLFGTASWCSWQLMHWGCWSTTSCWFGSGGCYFSPWMELKKKKAKGHAIFNRLHWSEDYDSLCHISQARPVSWGTSEEMEQDLGQHWFANPDTTISAVGCWLQNWTVSSPLPSVSTTMPAWLKFFKNMTSEVLTD